MVGLGQPLSALEGDVVEGVVGRGGVAGARAVEFGNVGAGRECRVPAPAQHDDADGRVGLGLRRCASGTAFHMAGGEGIHAGRVAGDDEADVAFAVAKPQMRSLGRRIAAWAFPSCALAPYRAVERFAGCNRPQSL